MEEGKERAASRHWFVRSGARVAALCTALALAAIMVLMVVDVTGRYVFNSPVPGAGELIELLMGIVIFSALPLTTAHGEHVKLDYFDGVIKGAAGRIIRFAVEIASASIVAFLAWRVAVKAGTILQYRDTTPFLNIPIGPIAVFVAAATAVTALIFVAKAYAALAHLRKVDYKAAR